MTKRERAERRDNDHYVTPDWAIRRFLEKYRPLESGRILDPCAAKGELIQTAKTFFPDSQFAACEINPEFEAELQQVTGGAVIMGDFLANVLVFQRVGFDLILTNPPYNQALLFIQAALQVGMTSPGGHRQQPSVAMLLRINFLASQARREFLAAAKPGVFVLPNRPSFTGSGGDMTEYGWFVFGDPHVAGRLDYLDVTPLGEIRAANERAREICGDVEVAA